MSGCTPWCGGAWNSYDVTKIGSSCTISSSGGEAPSPPLPLEKNQGGKTARCAQMECAGPGSAPVLVPEAKVAHSRTMLCTKDEARKGSKARKDIRAALRDLKVHPAEILPTKRKFVHITEKGIAKRAKTATYDTLQSVTFGKRLQVVRTAKTASFSTVKGVPNRVPPKMRKAPVRQDLDGKSRKMVK